MEIANVEVRALLAICAGDFQRPAIVECGNHLRRFKRLHVLLFRPLRVTAGRLRRCLLDGRLYGRDDRWGWYESWCCEPFAAVSGEVPNSPLSRADAPGSSAGFCSALCPIPDDSTPSATTTPLDNRTTAKVISMSRLNRPPPECSCSASLPVRPEDFRPSILNPQSPWFLPRRSRVADRHSVLIASDS